MFNVKLSTCGSAPAIEIAVSHISWERVWTLVCFGNNFFRETEIVNDETGEVAYSRYVSEDYFEPEITFANFCSIMEGVLRNDNSKQI